MALTVKHLNGDASVLLTFDSLLPEQAPFRILVDPWITGESKILHSKISVAKHKEEPCISSLMELPEPDLVVISQSKADHCNEASLRQLPSRDTKTIILAEPAAARKINGWNYFEQGKVRAFPKWGDPKLTAKQATLRFKVEPTSPGQVNPGEVTVAFIPQRRDISGLHGAIGITYRPPMATQISSLSIGTSISPPITPSSHRSCSDLRSSSQELSQSSEGGTESAPDTSLPSSPTDTTLRSVRSALSLSTALGGVGYSTATLASLTRPMSVIYSPHGTHYDSLESYITSHLIVEAALPLTALLHSFDSVTNPWWLGGNIILGAPAGIKIASRLGAKTWISTHDGEKDVKGFVTRFLRTKEWKAEDVIAALEEAELAWQREKQTLRYQMMYPPKKSTAEAPGTQTATTATSTGAAAIRINISLLRLEPGQEAIAANGPIVTIDRDTLVPKIQERPAIMTDTGSSGPPILRAPPHSPDRRYFLHPAGSSITTAGPSTTGGSSSGTPAELATVVDSSETSEDDVSEVATDSSMLPLSPGSSASSETADDESITPAMALSALTTAEAFLHESPHAFTKRAYTTSVTSLGVEDDIQAGRDLANLEAVKFMIYETA